MEPTQLNMDVQEQMVKANAQAGHEALQGAQHLMSGLLSILEQSGANRAYAGTVVVGVLLAWFILACARPKNRMTASPAVTFGVAAPNQALATKTDVQVMLENMIQHLEARLLQVSSSGADGGAATVTLSVDTVVDAVGQAINSKMMELKPFDRVMEAFSSATNSLNSAEKEGLKELVGLLKTVATSLETTRENSQRGADLAGAQTKQLDTLQQSLQAAGQTEQARFGTLDKQMKQKMEAHQEELLGKLSSFEQTFTKAMAKHDTDHACLEVLIAKLDGVASKFDKLPDALTKQGDRVEALLRERTSSLQEDVNKILGTVNTAFREEAGLHRKHSAALDSVQHALAELTAAIGRPPPDSEGATQSLEVSRNIEGILTEAYQVIQEIRDRTPERPPLRTPPSAQHQDPPPVQSHAMPNVIDLSRRIPPPVQGGIPNLATVTLASGRTVLAPEEEVLGFSSPYPHLQFQRRSN